VSRRGGRPMGIDGGCGGLIDAARGSGPGQMLFPPVFRHELKDSFTLPPPIRGTMWQRATAGGKVRNRPLCEVVNYVKLACSLLHHRGSSPGDSSHSFRASRNVLRASDGRERGISPHQAPPAARAPSPSSAGGFPCRRVVAVLSWPDRTELAAVP
jgi:hypothetical protein